MTVDTQELREAIASLKAEAGIEGWFDLSDELYEDSLGDGISPVSPIPETDFRYIVAAGPAKVSALLDEIDRLRESLAWCAGTLQMACDSAAKLREADTVGLAWHTRAVASVLDMANSALPPAPPQGEKDA